MTDLVSLRGLRLSTVDRHIVDGVDLTLAEGEAVGVVGTSGSGKTTMALAVLGHLREGIRHTGGSATVRGQAVLPHPPSDLRGGTIGYLGQDPGAALNPYARISSTLLTALGSRPARAGRAETVQRLLARVGLPGDTEFARRYPHQLSGGQQQRVALAAALAREPRLLVLDEPTTGLDVLAKAEIVAELRRLREDGVALLWVSHDLGTVGSLVDRLVVLDEGRVVEDGPAEILLSEPVSATARHLVAATKSRENNKKAGAAGIRSDDAVLSGESITAGYGDRSVLSEVDLSVRPGECLAVLGVSGVGKSTLARCLIGLHQPTQGRVLLRGEPLAADVRRRTGAERGAIGLVAQNPAEALHPRQDVRTALSRPLRLMRGMTSRTEQDKEIDRLLEAVRLPASVAGRLPGELSGGQRQRVALARALAAEPAVLICDEATSALDTATQADILELLGELRTRLGLAVVLITHDARVAATASDRVLVLADGRAVTTGVTGELLPADADPDSLVAVLLGDRTPPTIPSNSYQGASLV